MIDFRDSTAGDPFAMADPTERDAETNRKLEAARRAVDRRRRDERRRRRRARRSLRRVGWTLGGLLLLNAVAYLGLETPSDPMRVTTYVGVDKLGHLAAFALAAAAMIPLLARWLSPGVTLVLAIFGGLVIEVLQAYAPDRTADFADFVADEVGILIGWAVGMWILKLIRARVPGDRA